MHFSHCLCAQVVSVSSTVYQVRIFELRPATEKQLRDLLSQVANRSPYWTLDVVHSWRCWYMAVAITVELTATK